MLNPSEHACSAWTCPRCGDVADAVRLELRLGYCRYCVTSSMPPVARDGAWKAICLFIAGNQEGCEAAAYQAGTLLLDDYLARNPVAVALDDESRARLRAETLPLFEAEILQLGSALRQQFSDE